MAITTTRTLADYIGVSEADNLTLLTRLLYVAQKIAERFCGYGFDYGTHTETYDGMPSNGGVLYTKHRPITALLGLTDNNVLAARAIDTNTDVQWDYDDYKAVGKLELYNTEGAFSVGRRAIVVEYTAGYTTATAPADLVQAICEIAAALWEGTEALTRTEQSIDGAAIKWREKDIPPQAYGTLCAYKHWVF